LRRLLVTLADLFLLPLGVRSTLTSTNLSCPAYDSLAVALAFGLALAAVVAAVGHVSGAHVNPAVTLGMAATRKFPWSYVPHYVVAQLVGAVLAALATWITFGGPRGAGRSWLPPTLPGGLATCRHSSSRS
jgi:glycerol uptake facilitator-like aquaporin